LLTSNTVKFLNPPRLAIVPFRWLSLRSSTSNAPLKPAGTGPEKLFPETFRVRKLVRLVTVRAPVSLLDERTREVRLGKEVSEEGKEPLRSLFPRSRICKEEVRKEGMGPEKKFVERLRVVS